MLCRSSHRATIRLNADLIGDRADIALSTALHELGHVVFDVPGWLGSRQDDATSIASGGPLRLTRTEMPRPTEGDPDWREWRANEFMGGFLVPRSLLTKTLSKYARQLRLPMVEASTPNAPPLVVVDRYSTRFDDLTQSLAEDFGLTAAFLATRIFKYKMILSGA